VTAADRSWHDESGTDFVALADLLEAYAYGWGYAEMAVEPLALDWQLRDWSEAARRQALRGYVDRRSAYRVWDDEGGT
jgi:hypothetical protein